MFSARFSQQPTLSAKERNKILQVQLLEMQLFQVTFQERPYLYLQHRITHTHTPAPIMESHLLKIKDKDMPVENCFKLLFSP